MVPPNSPIKIELREALWKCSEQPNNVTISVFRLFQPFWQFWHWKNPAKTLKTKQFWPKPKNFSWKSNFQQNIFRCFGKYFISVDHYENDTYISLEFTLKVFISRGTSDRCMTLCRSVLLWDINLNAPQSHAVNIIDFNWYAIIGYVVCTGLIMLFFIIFMPRQQNYTVGPILLTNRPGPFFPEWPSRKFADRAMMMVPPRTEKSAQQYNFVIMPPPPSGFWV